MSEYTMNRWIMVVLLVLLCAVGVVASIIAGMRLDEIKQLDKQNKALVVQNVQLTKDSRNAEAEAFKMGLITCGNEDVDYLNELAVEYSGNALGKLFLQMAQTWAYDEDTLQMMVDGYMNGDTQ